MTDLTARLTVDVLNSERGGLGLFMVAADFTAHTDTMGDVTVPVGYKTDFASIPLFARWLIPQCGHSARGALLHDWLLHLGDHRATAVFSEALKAAGTGPIRRWLMVAFVWLWTYPELHWSWMHDDSGH